MNKTASDSLLRQGKKRKNTLVSEFYIQKEGLYFMKKKLMLLLCTVCAVTLLGGCGTGNKNTGGKKESTEKTEKTEEKDDSEKEKASIEYNVDDYVELGEYKGLEVSLGTYEVKDEDVKSRIESILTSYPVYEDLDKDTVEDGDFVNIDYEGIKDGEAFNGGTAEGAVLEIGSNSFIDGFEEGLIGKKVGEKTDLNLTFPEDYQNEELAGQEVVFHVTVNKIVSKTDMTYDQWVKDGYPVGYGEVIYFKETGELVMGKGVADFLGSEKAQLSVTYTKQGFKEGEVRPEHYFDCKNTTDPKNEITYVKENQEIKFTIAFGQELTINTQASDVLDASIGRDVDDLTNAVQAAIAAHDKVEKIKEMQTQQQYSDPASQEALSQWLEAAEKEAVYADDNMQKLYARGITKFQGYLDQVKLARTDMGSREGRLNLTENRMSNQQTTFEQLKSRNEDMELSDIIIEYTAAYNAYQASLQASAKANGQTLLNYL